MNYLSLLLKLVPVVFGMALGGGATLGIAKLVKPKIEIPPCPQPPACRCPPQANAIDFDKIKGYRGTIQLNQHYHVELKGDTVGAMFRKVLREELQGVKGYKPR
jgi:hypothetical protein